MLIKKIRLKSGFFSFKNPLEVKVSYHSSMVFMEAKAIDLISWGITFEECKENFKIELDYRMKQKILFKSNANKLPTN